MPTRAQAGAPIWLGSNELLLLGVGAQPPLSDDVGSISSRGMTWSWRILGSWTFRRVKKRGYSKGGIQPGFPIQLATIVPASTAS
jgi:hypothetical protein